MDALLATAAVEKNAFVFFALLNALLERRETAPREVSMVDDGKGQEAGETSSAIRLGTNNSFPRPLRVRPACDVTASAFLETATWIPVGPRSLLALDIGSHNEAGEVRLPENPGCLFRELLRSPSDFLALAAAAPKVVPRSVPEAAAFLRPVVERALDDVLQTQR